MSRIRYVRRSFGQGIVLMRLIYVDDSKMDYGVHVLINPMTEIARQ